MANFIDCLQVKDDALLVYNKFANLPTYWLEGRKTKHRHAGRQIAKTASIPSTRVKTKKLPKQVDKLTDEEVVFYNQNEPLISRYRCS